MRPGCCANDVKGITNTGYPVAHGLVHRIFECRCAAFHGHNFRTQNFHTEDIRCLSSNIFFTHKYFAFHAEERCNRCRRHTMLSRAGFRNDFFLPHPAGKQCLPQRIVYFVRAGMIQIFPFQINFSPAQYFCHMVGKIKWSFASGILFLIIDKFFLKRFIFFCGVISFFQID